MRLPSPKKGIDVSGLAIVDALSRAWGSTPTSSGKTVWAVIGPENQLKLTSRGDPARGPN